MFVQSEKVLRGLIMVLWGRCAHRPYKGGWACRSHLWWKLAMALWGLTIARPCRYFFQQVDTIVLFILFFLLLLQCQASEALTGLRVGDKTYKRRWFNVLSAACETSQISMYPHGKAMVNAHGFVYYKTGIPNIRYNIRIAWASALLILGWKAMREPCVRDEWWFQIPTRFFMGFLLNNLFSSL